MKKYLIALIAVLIVIGGVVGINSAKALVTIDTSVQIDQYRVFDFFATSTSGINYATTTNATSTDITPFWDSNGRLDTGMAHIAGAKRVTLYFTRGSTSANAGSSTFKIQVTPDGTNWYDYNKLIQNTATTSQNTSVASVAITGTSTVITSLDLFYDNFYGIRCNVRIATDGTALCKATIVY
jgi:hypothetical protein